ncbi:MAG: class I tRNA ligase family protein, partial [Chloroflexota bacterium]
SRQLWWGHRIPAWYCPDGHVTVSDDAAGPSACATCGRARAELEQDPDIFDTWFSSGLWPFSTLGWPDDTPDLRRFYPGTVMETGYDIIFFWVARMMMLGIHFMDEPPFETVYLHGLVRTGGGAKMSKTAGNVVDPLEAIDEIGADALRFALIHGIAPGADQKFTQEKLENARNFGNKLWNAARFVLGARPSSIPADAARRGPDLARLGPADRWLRSRMAATVSGVDEAMDGFAFGEATRLLYETTWNEFCDWGLELAKVRLADQALPEADREATWWALVEALDGLLRLLHPFLPFVTEAIWAATPHAADDPELLIVADWPDPGAWAAARDIAVEGEVDRVRALISEIRNARATARIAPGEGRPADVLVPADLAATFDALVPAIERLARVRPLTRHADRAAFLGAERSGSLAVIAGDLEVRIAAGPADATAERTRLERELADAERQLNAAEARLANQEFLDKAPPTVVDGARARATELADQVARLRERLGGS